MKKLMAVTMAVLLFLAIPQVGETVFGIGD